MHRTRTFALAFGLISLPLATACLDTSGPTGFEDEPGAPPLNATIFIDPDIMTDSDPTAYDSVAAMGTGERSMFDRRSEAFVTLDAYLFDAVFDDGLTAEVQVNPEFSAAEALAAAQFSSAAIGRMPTILRSEVQAIVIHRGEAAFGGGSNALIVHTDQAEIYEADGILEEALAHEAVHTSLDVAHAGSAGWLSAQSSDPSFISGVAQDFPTIEDVAESFLPYIAVRHRSDRITAFLAGVITDAIPARLAYFDAQGFNMYPLQ